VQGDTVGAVDLCVPAVAVDAGAVVAMGVAAGGDKGIDREALRCVGFVVLLLGKVIKDLLS